MGAGASSEAFAEGDILEKIDVEGADSDLEAEKSEQHERRDVPEDGPVERAVEGGFCYRQPCRGSIFGPTGWETRPDAHMKPRNRLELHYVHGYRAHDARHNIGYTKEKSVVYHAAAVGIVLDPRTRTQKFFFGHTDDILCLDTHPTQSLAVTGQVGKEPSICVWDTVTMEKKAELKGFHQRAVVAIAFHPQGRMIGTVGLDDNHSVALYDWAAGKLVASAKGDTNRIYYCDFNPKDGRLVTVGEKHVKFFSLENGELVGRKGVYGKVGAVSTALSIAFTPDGCTLTGHMGGQVFKWAEGGNQAIKCYPGLHQGPVHELVCSGDFIISGGKDGKVKCWSAYMELKMEVDLGKVVEVMVDGQGSMLSFFNGKSPCVKALSYDDSRKKLLVGTKSSEIFEFDVSTPDSYRTNHELLVQGHASALDEEKKAHCGEVWGLDCHPSKAQFLTCSDDKSVRLWSIPERRMLSMRKVPFRARSVAYHPKGEHAALGTMGGTVVIFDCKTGHQVTQFRFMKEWVSVVKYSPCGKYLAVGSHDNYVMVFDVYRGKEGGYKPICKCKGHASYITCLDWSTDSTILQTNSGDNDLLFWSIPSGEQIKFPSELRDREWATWTCTLGWPVQGIWPKYADGTDINACARTKQGSWAENECVLVTADDFGLIKLFHYPCDVARADYNAYEGHAAHVTNVCFSHNDKYLISTGGGDRCVFQWRHLEDGEADGSDSDEEEAVRDEKIEHTAGNQATLMIPLGMENGVMRWEPVNAAEGKPNPYKNHGVRELGAKKGMKSPMVGRPCLGQTFMPTGFTPGPSAYDMPRESLQLEWVYGYRGYDTRNSVYYTKDGHIAYFVAAWAIAYDPQGHRQRHLTDDPMTASESEGNTDDILCMARHPDGQHFATGEIGRTPKIIVWDSETMKGVAELRGFHSRAVVSVSFSPDGKHLASVGLDDDHSVAIYDWRAEQLLATYKGDKNKVLDIVWSPFAADPTIVTVGIKHAKFCKVPSLAKGTKLAPKKGVVSEKGKVTTFYTAAFLGPDTVATGTKEGALYIFNGPTLSKTVEHAHKGRLQALTAVHGNGGVTLVTGGDDGQVKVWAVSDFSVVAQVSLASAPNKVCSSLRSLFALDPGCILAGTAQGEIFEIKGSKATLITQGHGEGEMWGLATHPTDPNTVATSSDDGTLRVWDVRAKRMVSATELVPKREWQDIKATSFHTGCIRCVEYGPGGAHIAAGMFNGKVFVLDAGSMELIKEINQREEWISAIRWSPDGRYMAVASHDNFVDVYDVEKDYKRVGCCKGHSSFITHMDWSKDSSKLFTNSGDYEIMFWDMPKGSQIKFSSSCKDVEWATYTSVLGWPVIGIWPKGSDGTDINTTCRDKTGSCIATGDDFGMVSLFKYPALGGSAKIYGGHSSHVTTVRFSSDNHYLYSSGGADTALAQWKLIG
eukprot:jgi/Mesvir1/17598/Mv08830-RA.1